MQNDHTGTPAPGTPTSSAPTLPRRFAPVRLGWVLIVAAGGALGAFLRLVFTLVIPEQGGMAWSILLVNVLGSALLGMLSVLAANLWPERPGVSLFWGTGLLGGFTTFSTVMVAAVVFPTTALHQQVTGPELGHAFLVAILYLLLNIALSLTVAWLGTIGAEGALRYRAEHPHHGKGE